MTEAAIIQKPVRFLYDNALRHERVKYDIIDYGETLNLQKKSFVEPGNKVSLIY